MIWPLLLGAGIGVILCVTVSAITGLWPFDVRPRKVTSPAKDKPPTGDLHTYRKDACCDNQTSGEQAGLVYEVSSPDSITVYRRDGALVIKAGSTTARVRAAQ